MFRCLSVIDGGEAVQQDDAPVPKVAKAIDGEGV